MGLLPARIHIHSVWSSKFAGSSRSTMNHIKKELHSFGENVRDSGSSNLLIVSGTGKKKKAINSLSILQSLKNCNTMPLIGCAFNPYIGCNLDPGMDKATRRREEFERLRCKLKCKSVKSVWLQYGIDCEALLEGLEVLRSSIEFNGRDDITLYGSLFIPSKSWIAKMKFRCWSGVYLGDKVSSKYFNGHGEEKTLAILDIYKEHGIIPVIESSIRSKRDIDQCVQLFHLKRTKHALKQIRIIQNSKLQHPNHLTAHISKKRKHMEE